MVLAFMPLVARDQVQEWQEYAAVNNAWRQDDVAASMGIPVSEVKIPPYRYDIHVEEGHNATELHDGPYAVLWNTYPPLVGATAANVDFRSDAEHVGAIDTVLRTGQPSFEAPFSYIGREEEYQDDVRYNLFINNPHTDYQGDAFTAGFFPSKCGTSQCFCGHKRVSFTLLFQW